MELLELNETGNTQNWLLYEEKKKIKVFFLFMIKRKQNQDWIICTDRRENEKAKHFYLPKREDK